MAVLADHRYRFCCGYPVVAHVGVSLSEREFKFPVVCVMVRSHGASGVMLIGQHQPRQRERFLVDLK